MFKNSFFKRYWLILTHIHEYLNTGLEYVVYIYFSQIKQFRLSERTILYACYSKSAETQLNLEKWAPDERSWRMKKVAEQLPEKNREERQWQ